jgi:tubulin monoglycylase TTLL3/8
MWAGDMFQKYLAEQNGGADIYTTKIQPQVKQGIIGSVLAARDMVINREKAHEMFGYDFMVDTNLNVWLIEVNSSPSMEHSTVRYSMIFIFYYIACNRETGQEHFDRGT